MLKKLTLVVAIATSMLSAPALAQSFQGGNTTVFNPTSPAVTGGGSVGYNESQENPAGVARLWHLQHTG